MLRPTRVGAMAARTPNGSGRPAGEQWVCMSMIPGIFPPFREWALRMRLALCNHRARSRPTKAGREDRMRSRIAGTIAILAGGLVAAASPVAAQQSVADFYRGK